MSLKELEAVVPGGKAVGNAGSDTIFSFITIGGLLADESSNPAKFAVTQQDLDNDYGLSYGIARGSQEFLFGVATAGASAALSNGGKAASVLGKGLNALDFAGNVSTAGQGVANAIENGGLNLQNTVQILGGAAGITGNLSGALRGARAADDLADSTRVADTLHAKPKAIIPEPTGCFVAGTTVKCVDVSAASLTASLPVGSMPTLNYPMLITAAGLMAIGSEYLRTMRKRRKRKKECDIADDAIESLWGNDTFSSFEWTMQDLTLGSADCWWEVNEFASAQFNDQPSTSNVEVFALAGSDVS